MRLDLLGVRHRLRSEGIDLRSAVRSLIQDDVGAMWGPVPHRAWSTSIGGGGRLWS